MQRRRTSSNLRTGWRRLRPSLAILFCAVACGLWPRVTSAASAPGQASYVCLIVLDAGRPDYVTKNLDEMPTMRSMLQGGRWYDNAWVGDLLAITPPSHAVLGSGSLPKDDGGIVNWDWGVKNHQHVSPSLQNLTNYQNGYAFKLIKDSGTPTLAGVIHQKYPNGLVVAGAGSHFAAAGPMGGPDANWIVAYQRQNGYWAPYSLGSHKAPSSILRDPSLRMHLTSSNGTTIPLLLYPVPLGDEGLLTSRLMAKTVISSHPRAVMMNVAGPDAVGHWSMHWRQDMRKLYATIDQDLGMLVSAYKRAGIYKQTLFVITSDHGMARSAHRVVDRNLVAADVGQLGGKMLLMNSDAGGTMLPLWLKNPDASRHVALGLYARHIDNVAAVFYLQRGKTYQYRLAGCDACSPTLVKAYKYLLDTAAGPTGEDVALLFRENARMSGWATMQGRHSGADWASQHITLLLSGPGVKHGVSHVPAREVDIAPTIERFMGLKPQARDGKVLADAFVSPTPSDRSTQQTVDRPLQSYVTAIKQRGQSDAYLEAHGLVPNHIPADELPRVTPLARLLMAALQDINAGIGALLAQSQSAPDSGRTLVELDLLVSAALLCVKARRRHAAKHGQSNLNAHQWGVPSAE